ncbi:hypothetical protein GQ53DRAFT_605254, partial [Thozetella sp. PMI_491]
LHDGTLRPIYEKVIDKLDGIVATLHGFPNTKEMTHAFIWLPTASSGFVPVLRCPGPPQKASVVFCYFCMVLEQLPKEWWLGDW